MIQEIKNLLVGFGTTFIILGVTVFLFTGCSGSHYKVEGVLKQIKFCRGDAVLLRFEDGSSFYAHNPKQPLYIGEHQRIYYNVGDPLRISDNEIRKVVCPSHDPSKEIYVIEDWVGNKATLAKPYEEEIATIWNPNYQEKGD